MKAKIVEFYHAMVRYWIFAKIIRTQKRYARYSKALRELAYDEKVIKYLDDGEMYDVFGHRVGLRIYNRPTISPNISRGILQFNDYGLSARELELILEPQKISAKRILDHADFSERLHHLAEMNVKIRQEARLSVREVKPRSIVKKHSDGE